MKKDLWVKGKLDQKPLKWVVSLYKPRSNWSAPAVPHSAHYRHTPIHGVYLHFCLYNPLKMTGKEFSFYICLSLHCLPEELTLKSHRVASLAPIVKYRNLSPKTNQY